MKSLIIGAATLLVLGVAIAQDQPAAPQTRATEQADATDPNASEPNAPTGRKPFQDEILKALLQEQELPRVIRQQDPQRGTTVKIGPMARDEATLLEGTMVVERPAQFTIANGKPQLSLTLADLNRTATLEVLPSKLLEALEREFESGVAEFIVSGEVTRYKEEAYILLRKVVQRVNNGNIRP